MVSRRSVAYAKRIRHDTMMQHGKRWLPGPANVLCSLPLHAWLRVMQACAEVDVQQCLCMDSNIRRAMRVLNSFLYVTACTAYCQI
jgi:hypothetical protein